MGLENIKTTLINSKNGNSFSLNSPLIAASGTYGYVDEFEDFIDLNCFGAISTKGMTITPRLGNSGDRIFEVKGGLINRIGLENIGIDAFISEKLPKLKEKNINFVLNIAGSTLEDYEKMAQIAQINKIKAIEINVSCPNVKQGCLEFGLNPEQLFKLTKTIRKNYDGFLIVKLSPNTADIKPLAAAVEAGGADCISAINTIRALGIKLDFINEKFFKKSVQGGLSGECIKPVALYMVQEIKRVVNIPIIAIGGISSLYDLFEFILVGADAFQIGTANFIKPNIMSALAKELSEFIEKNNFKDFNTLKEAIRND